MAAVLGHEIAHNVANHTGEKISQMFYILPIVIALSYYFDTSAQYASLILDFAVQRPGSRKMETEADLLGLLMYVFRSHQFLVCDAFGNVGHVLYIQYIKLCLRS